MLQSLAIGATIPARARNDGHTHDPLSASGASWIFRRIGRRWLDDTPSRAEATATAASPAQVRFGDRQPEVGNVGTRSGWVAPRIRVSGSVLATCPTGKTASAAVPTDCAVSIDCAVSTDCTEPVGYPESVDGAPANSAPSPESLGYPESVDGAAANSAPGPGPVEDPEPVDYSEAVGSGPTAEVTAARAPKGKCSAAH
jgi:hypothetical protein